MLKSLITILSLATVSAVQLEIALRCKNGSECVLSATNASQLQAEQKVTTEAKVESQAQGQVEASLEVQAKLETKAVNTQEKPTVPFLPPKTSQKDWTLILDMDETLIHFNHEHFSTPQALKDGGVINFRPGAQEFLRAMSQEYELVIFTAAEQEYADWVLNQLDKDRIISHRLYRQHVSRLDEGGILKDLNLLGRDLSKCVIVDDTASNFANLPQNGIQIKKYIEDPNDTELSKLSQRLISMLNHPSNDIRIALATVTY